MTQEENCVQQNTFEVPLNYWIYYNRCCPHIKPALLHFHIDQLSNHTRTVLIKFHKQWIHVHGHI